jgi:tRNA-specific 2-thiouridylase
MIGPGSAKKGTVAVAMSGGVDSSLAAMLLAEQGYEVVGFTLRLHDEGDGVNASASQRDRRCCATDGAERARQAALRAGGRHYVVDARREFEQAVLQDFQREYAAGRTPNPCVRCNTHIKWGFLIRHAERLGAEWFATGHHARVDRSDPSAPRLLCAVDPSKDQGYALWGIGREGLSRTLLPIGEYPKTEVRRMAEERGLAASHVPDSQEICFVADDDYRGFLARRFEREAVGSQVLEPALAGGQIVDSGGEVLGRHDGYARYTLGQRRGLAVAAGRRLYVEGIEPETRRIVVGDGGGLMRQGLDAGQANWVSIPPPTAPLRADVRIRYNGDAVPARITPTGPRTFRVRFDEPQRAAAAGQSAVAYDGDVVLGGGVISA